MSSSFLEKARTAMEDVDALEALAVETLDQRVSGAKATMERDQVVANVAREMARCAKTITWLQGSKEFEEEKASMRGVGVFTNFYGQLKQTREYYAKHGATLMVAPATRSTAVEAAKRLEVAFSGEEMWGKYVDLGSLHRGFCNLPGGVTLDYMAYLRMMLNRKFSTHAIIPGDDQSKKVRGTSRYAQYVEEVEAYLVDFWRRAQPLISLESILDEPMREFEASRKAEEEYEPVDLDEFQSADELERLGLERLKEGLLALDLKCGGDVKERAKRLFSVKGLERDEIDSRLKAKKAEAASRRANVARLERRIEAILEHLEGIIEATLRRAERKLTRTKDEIDQELEDEELGVRIEEDEEDDEDEDGDDLAAIYNPKNLPLGWDGRPIPYWLYKLHGLDVAFQCEICGNHTYYGRRAFEQHFNEWRHSHGMRCLRIPNTKHFHGVTKMDDAIALWEQLQEKLETDRFKPDRDEEYEDSDGNVLNRATYEDLARQGLL
ncbi:hypothetical protein CTAYLR_008131 [Chrysophaeum taylorii]|uniref:Matrin-type domain-containing protein n=1 Tax=Chrysophaeum taylorii TaxID=2483200 RepID=A0AAD7XLN9_9STRA|nr:hypothetical protein CTAYLR_008131 [Chrysophaeum taylorii]